MKTRKAIKTWLDQSLTHLEYIEEYLTRAYVEYFPDYPRYYEAVLKLIEFCRTFREAIKSFQSNV